MSVKLEIERRFLMKRVPVSLLRGMGFLEIDQWYSETGERYRRTRDGNTTRYYVTKKKVIQEGVFEEDETELTEKVSDEMITPIGWPSYDDRVNMPWVSKLRYVYYDPKQDLKFEIDTFENMINLVIMEVELKDINQEFEIPEDIKKEVIVEITGMKGISNRALAEKG